jgi:alpha-glucosidase
MATNGDSVSERQATTAATEWWRTAVVYQTYVRSFADSDGDGIGDLRGVASRLDYLQRLGVEAIWLTPCYPSPQRDHGYDVSDYFSIEPDYGTLDDFDDLVDQARRHGIKVLMDVVPNHCSSEHAWFRAALAAAPGSPERDRFYFRDGRGPGGSEPPNDWLAVFGGPAWQRVTEANGTPGQWYLFMFTPDQPDLNWRNDDVLNHFDDMLRFWFDRGVDGFRVDAVTVVGKEEDLPDAGLLPWGKAGLGDWETNRHAVFHPSAHDVWRRWRTVINEYERTHPGRTLVTISEAYIAGRPDLMAEYVGGTQFHQMFAFDLMLAPWTADEYRSITGDVIDQLAALNATPTWTMNNHDVQRVVTRLGRANADDPAAATRNNLLYVDAPVDDRLGTERGRAVVAYVAALPGAVYLYCGEELGLPEVLDLPDEVRQDPFFIRSGGAELGRDGCRVPLPWTADAATSWGFSESPDDGEVAAPWLPQPAEWGRFAADAQALDPQSMLWWYRTVFAARRQLDDEFEWVDEVDDISEDLVGFRRGDTLVLINFGAEAVTLPGSLVADRQVALSSSVVQHGPTRLPANTCAWLRPRPR